MTRESNYRIHEELKATKQRPWQPPSAPPRRLPAWVAVVAMIAVVAATCALTGGIL